MSLTIYCQAKIIIITKCIDHHIPFHSFIIIREPHIDPKLADRLWAYMGGIAKENNMKALIINGMEVHAHVLLTLPSTITIAKSIQLIKGGSSYWVHRTFPEYQHFEWQKGYGAFSVGQSNISKTINYIKNQKKHHQNKDLKNEFLGLL